MLMHADSGILLQGLANGSLFCSLSSPLHSYLHSGPMGCGLEGGWRQYLRTAHATSTTKTATLSVGWPATASRCPTIFHSQTSPTCARSHIHHAIRSRTALLYYAPPHFITPHHTKPHYITPHRTTLHYTIPHHTTPHHGRCL